MKDILKVAAFFCGVFGLFAGTMYLGIAVSKEAGMSFLAGGLLLFMYGMTKID